MKGIPCNVKEFGYTHAVVLVAVLATWIRAKGVPYGYPIPTHPDEMPIITAAIRMNVTGDLNPYYFIYPGLNIYLHAILIAVGDGVASLFGTTILSESAFWCYMLARSLNVVLSTLTIVMVYHIGRRLFSPLAGLIAAVFLTTSYLHIVRSYMLTVDTTVAFWSVLSTFFSVRIFQGERSLRNYLLAGVCVGCAVSSKYTAVWTALPLIATQIFITKHWKEFLTKPVLLAAVIAPVTFLITNPYAVLDFPRFWATIEDLRGHYSKGHLGNESATSTSYLLYLEGMFYRGYGVLPSLIGICGVVLMFMKKRREAVLLFIYPAAMFFFVGNYKAFFMRNLVSCVPYFALFGGYALAELYRALVKPKPSSGVERPPKVVGWVIALVVLVSVVNPLYRSLERIRVITLPDTRVAGLMWVLQHIPSGSIIAREQYTPPVENWSRRFDVRYLGMVGLAKRPEEHHLYDYILVSSLNYDRVLQDPRTPDRAATYQTIYDEYELMQEFVADRQTLGGPTVRVFKVPKSQDSESPTN